MAKRWFASPRWSGGSQKNHQTISDTTMSRQEPGHPGHTPPPTQVPHRLVTVRYLEKHYGFSKSYWAKHRERGTGPRFGVYGHRSIRYWEDEVVAWFESRMVMSTSDLRYHELSPRLNPSLLHRHPNPPSKRHENNAALQAPVTPSAAPPSHPRSRTTQRASRQTPT